MLTDSDSLSPRHRAFVAAYVRNGCNATEAYRSVYGCTENTARVNGSRLLSKADVRDAVQAAFDADAMSSAEVLHRLTRIARNEGAAYLRPDGSHDLDAMLGDGGGFLVERVRVDAAGVVTVQLHDAMKALATLARVHGLAAPARVTVDVPDVSADRLGGVLAALVARVAKLPDDAAGDGGQDDAPPSARRSSTAA